MRVFHCQCGHPVYFSNHRCINCGADLGFDPATLTMRARLPGQQTAEPFIPCKNGGDHGVCNWLCQEGEALCWGCQFNRQIPDLSNPLNLQRWDRFERAKKRLLYTLLSLGLPINNGHADQQNGLLFDLLEDSRSDAVRYPESFVATGFAGGVITINTLETDDASREAMKVEMKEGYRTVLGHLRHESGHYYFSMLGDYVAELRDQFGDFESDYATALDRHYQQGPPDGWETRYISAYASAHPSEDWAETWGHYLQIHDVLETAADHGLPEAPGDFRGAIGHWRKLSITLNELNRSMGLADAYPFVVTPAIEEKLACVDAMVNRLRTSPPSTAAR
ncbi:MAG: putative zinc-binding metallopeptidase [Xanthomonadales bacterium]|nr:putative zinc-binding metallopeptidase [Xanthomonadales bacterium]